MASQKFHWTSSACPVITPGDQLRCSSTFPGAHTIIALSEESFKIYLSPWSYDRRLFALSSTHGPTGYRVMIPHLPIQQFCIRPASSSGRNASHIEVTLSTSLGGDATYPKGVYLYFATLASHELLQDTQHWGAYFVILDDRTNRFHIVYACSFTLRLCRAGSSCRTAHPNILPAMLVKRDTTVLVDRGTQIPLRRHCMDKLLTTSSPRPKLPWPGNRRRINMSEVRGGISKRKYHLYTLASLICMIRSYLGFPYLSFLFLSPVFLVWIYISVLHFWTVSGGAYRAFISSYTGHPQRSRPTHIRSTLLINMFLLFIRYEGLTLWAAKTAGMTLKTLPPSFRQMRRWNRSLEEVIYSDAKVDYRGRVREGTVPGLYNFSFRGTTAAPRTELQSNAFESLGPKSQKCSRSWKKHWQNQLEIAAFYGEAECRCVVSIMHEPSILIKRFSCAPLSLAPETETP